jgi:hypothetical protein
MATEEQIRARHERYEVIPGSREVLEVTEGEVLTAGHLQRGYGQMAPHVSRSMQRA